MNMLNFCVLPDNKFLRKIFIFIMFCLIVLTAFLTRSYDCARESLRYADFMPFTLECAMMYSYSYDIAKDGKIPKDDMALVGAENVSAASQMSISLEYFLGYAYRIKEHILSFFRGDNPDFSPDNLKYNINTHFVDWIRFQLRLWISLSAGLIFIWLLLLDTGFLFSILGGLLFAVAPAAIARATGQDIIRENFAIPLILLTFVSYYCFLLRKPNILKLLLLAVTAALALVSWDMTILCFSLWGIYELIIVPFNRDNVKSKLEAWIAIFIVCIASGLFNPYLFTHNFLCSPLVAIIIPSLIFGLCITTKRTLVRLPLILCVIVILTSLWFLVIKNLGFSDNYSHFYSLLLAKIKFANVQPLNPSLLDFNSRILWTPALHSATVFIYWHLFHFVMLVFIIFFTFAFVFKRTRAKLTSSALLPVVFSKFFFVLFIFMVRFHSLAIPFICVSIALLGDIINKAYKRRSVKYLIYFILIGLIALEVYYFINMRRRYDDDFKAQLALVSDLNPDSIKGKVVLSDFTISPMLKAYCGARIVLQPKFEMKGARDAVEEYLNIMFHGSEKQFMEFCRKHKVEYFIFDTAIMNGGKKEFVLHPWSSRYIANANVVSETAPVYLFYHKPETLTYFYQIDGQENSKQNRFVVFKVIYPKDIAEAYVLYLKAEKSGYKEKLKLINQAFLLNPASPDIRYLYYTLNGNVWPEYNLKAK